MQELVFFMILVYIIHMKKFIVFLTLITAAVIAAAALTGCAAPKEKVSAETFAAKAETAGYTVTKEGQSKTAASKNGYTIYFTVYADDDAAKTAFDTKCKDTVDATAMKSLYVNVDMPNYNYHKFTANNEKYYVLYRAWDTVLTVEAGKDYKKEINAFLKDIGY